MAEKLFNYYASENEKLKDKLFVSSAGIFAFEGDDASENSILALKEKWKIDLSSHKAKKLDKKTVDEADLILTMTQEHKNVVVSMFVHAKDKVFTLKEYVEVKEKIKGQDIRDPYGLSLEEYKNCADEIAECVKALLHKIDVNDAKNNV